MTQVFISTSKQLIHEITHSTTSRFESCSRIKKSSSKIKCLEIKCNFKLKLSTNSNTSFKFSTLLLRTGTDYSEDRYSYAYKMAEENASRDDTMAFGPKDLPDLVIHVSAYTDFNLLLAVQIFLPKLDSKDFIDKVTKRPIEGISSDFARLQKELGIDRFDATDRTDENDADLDSLLEYVTKMQPQATDKHKIDALEKFIDENYDAPGIDLMEHPLEDYRDEPPFLSGINNKNVRDVTLELNGMWKRLSRIAVPKEGRISTLLDLPHPFIVPGGRFREFYYWDTYFVLEGLLVSNMNKTAINIIKNFVHIIDELGYMPNGTRKYYMYRSQPPFFPLMLSKFLDLDGGEYNDLVLGKGLDMALKEYIFFDNHRSVFVRGNDGKLHHLNYFHVTTDFPRPESMSEDMNTFLSQHKLSEREMYSNLKSGAESGWDFSSRWFKDETDISTINVYNLIPVGLNAILFKNEQIISNLLKRAGRHDESRKFRDLSLKRMESINHVLWNSDVNAWNDFDPEDRKFVSRRFYFSNLFPLIMGIKPPTGNIYNVLQNYQNELFSYKGGVPASGPGKETGQQWDFPNVWAPHQFLIVEFLYDIGEHEMALQIARSFYNSVFVGFQQKGVFFEKYKANNLGFTGLGGEYVAQTGFGWTNGTALSFISRFKDQLAEMYDHQGEFDKIVKLLVEKASRRP